MIEIVYDKATAEKNAKNDGHYRMPKNIRQIGNAPDKKKIYIEDYVMTFLRKIAEPGNTTSRGAIISGASSMRISINILKICQLWDGFYPGWDFQQKSMTRLPDFIWKIFGEEIRYCLLWILWNVMMPFMYVRRTG